MSYDENRISDLIDGGLHQQKQEYMSKVSLDEFYKEWCKKTKRNGGVLIGNSIKELISATIEWQQNQHKQVKGWTYCPECGCEEIVNENLVGDGFRQCENCGQEWWKDIDYTATVRLVLIEKEKKLKASIQKQANQQP